MADRREVRNGRPAPRLYLVTQPISDSDAWTRPLAQTLAAADVAAVLMRLAPADERSLITRIKALAPTVQDAGAALIVDERADLVARAGADGAHLVGLDAFEAAVEALRPARIAGLGGLKLKHDALVAAERGADYVLFGEPDRHGERPPLAAVLDRISWWSEVVEVPCVGFAGSFDEVEALAGAGADFVALGDFVWTDMTGAAAAVAEAARRLNLVELAS